MKEYWIIDTESSGEHMDSKTAIGPFSSVKLAENWLRDDAKENFLSCDGSLRENTELPWAEPMHIVEVVKTVRQVPSAKVTVKLQSL